MKKVEILGLATVPQIEAGDKLGEIIVGCAEDEAGGIEERDVIVVTSKIVSKAENRVIALREVKPDPKALRLATKTGKAASRIQLILDDGQDILAVIPLPGLAEKYIMHSTSKPDQARQLLDKERCILVTRDREGRVHTYDGGIDSSNHPEGVASLPPLDPDRSAREIRNAIEKLTGKRVAVLIADTEIVPFGSIDLATGCSGIEPISKKFGEPDMFGKPKFGGMDIIAYELTAAAALLLGQTDEGVPVAIVRGLDYVPNEEENILNTLVADPAQLGRTARSAIAATTNIGGFKGRMLSWVLRLFALS
ncbi:MAG TPA: coenzyme F420-0:L-glutamate ligase [Anaerolineae bacterium]|nr:coenzyme F420-0:L-glutamate ligase [Anaerolineae bacterium]HQH39223.1 coenzyme F420-0:L-glutamate ligase [Anaerolineae bacterium]